MDDQCFHSFSSPSIWRRVLSQLDFPERLNVLCTSKRSYARLLPLLWNDVSISSVQTFIDIVAYFKRHRLHSSTVRYLSFDPLVVPELELGDIQLLLAMTPNLTNLTLTNGFHLSNLFVQCLSERCRKLCVVDISGCRVSDTFTARWLRLCPRIRELNLSQTLISLQTVFECLKLSGLKVLNVSFTQLSSDETVAGSVTSSGIEELEMRGASIDANDLQDILKRLPQLRKLNVSKAAADQTEDLAKLVAQSSNSVTELVIDYENISDYLKDKFSFEEQPTIVLTIEHLKELRQIPVNPWFTPPSTPDSEEQLHHQISQISLQSAPPHLSRKASNVELRMTPLDNDTKQPRQQLRHVKSYQSMSAKRRHPRNGISVRNVGISREKPVTRTDSRFEDPWKGHQYGTSDWYIAAQPGWSTYYSGYEAYDASSYYQESEVSSRGQKLAEARIEVRMGQYDSISIYEKDDPYTLATEFCRKWSILVRLQEIALLVSKRKMYALQSLYSQHV